MLAVPEMQRGAGWEGGWEASNTGEGDAQGVEWL